MLDTIRRGEFKKQLNGSDFVAAPIQIGPMALCWMQNHSLFNFSFDDLFRLSWKCKSLPWYYSMCAVMFLLSMRIIRCAQIVCSNNQNEFIRAHSHPEQHLVIDNAIWTPNTTQFIFFFVFISTNIFECQQAIEIHLLYPPLRHSVEWQRKRTIGNSFVATVYVWRGFFPINAIDVAINKIFWSTNSWR